MVGYKPSPPVYSSSEPEPEKRVRSELMLACLKWIGRVFKETILWLLFIAVMIVVFVHVVVVIMWLCLRIKPYAMPYITAYMDWFAELLKGIW